MARLHRVGLRLTEELVARGWAVLRFNFRGLGSSEGEHGLGIDEVADATGALAYMRDRYDLPLAIAGWSFGGAVALRVAATDADLAACVCVAPAIASRPGITDGAPPPEDFSFEGPTLIVCGANDDQISPAECRAWAESAGARYEEVTGANHFFWAKYEPLAGLVGDFLDNAV